MNSEQRTAYELARKYGARKTMLYIRAGASAGKVQRVACAEVGIDVLVSALVESQNPFWMLWALRWVSELSPAQCDQLLILIGTDSEVLEHVRWVLAHMRHLGAREEQLLKRIVGAE